MNFLNLDEYESTMSTFMANLALTNPKLAEWAVRLAGKTLKSHYLEELSKSCSPGVAFRETHALASQMGVRLSLVVTEQHFIVQEMSNPDSTRYLTTLREADKETVEWARRAVLDGRLVYRLNVVSPGIIEHLAEAVANQLGDRKRDVYSVTYQTAAKWAREWQEREERKAKEKEGEIKLVYSKDGLHIWELLDTQSRAREGMLMHHCVGYHPMYKTPRIDQRIYSVRDEEGKSLGTIEHRATGVFMAASADDASWSRTQFRAASNAEPEKALKDYVSEWEDTIPNFVKPISLKVGITPLLGSAGGVDSMLPGAELLHSSVSIAAIADSVLPLLRQRLLDEASLDRIFQEVKRRYQGELDGVSQNPAAEAQAEAAKADSGRTTTSSGLGQADGSSLAAAGTRSNSQGS